MMNPDSNYHQNNDLGIKSLPRIVTFPSRPKLICKVLIDLVMLIILLLPILLFFKWGKPYERGFFCNDDSIRYPYHDNTISSTLLFIYSLSIPMVVICANELLIYRSLMTGFDLSSRFFLKNYCWQIYLNLVPFAFACLSSQLITDIAKYSIGRLRPHFLDVCQPKDKQGNIFTRFSRCSSPEIYITDFVCNKSEETRIRDARLSFMSGHSSLCAVALMYLVFYIQVRVQWRNIGLFKQFFQYLLICLILYTGFSRISDYKHHWSDVLIGLIQGTLVATVCAFFVSDLYKPRSHWMIMDSNNDINPISDGNNPTNNQANCESGV